MVSDYGFLACELGEKLSRFFVTQKFEIILASALLNDEKYIQFDKSVINDIMENVSSQICEVGNYWHQLVLIKSYN